jgi:hypothetical protein
MAMITRWLMEEWGSQFAKRANLTLRFDESCGYDLLVAQKRRSPGVLLRIARSLLPSIELWIRIEGTEGAARCVLKARMRRVILNADGSAQTLMEEAYAAIIDTLAKRTDGKLKDRFEYGAFNARRSHPESSVNI